jgi:hypothetical protein
MTIFDYVVIANMSIAITLAKGRCIAAFCPQHISIILDGIATSVSLGIREDVNMD